MGRCKAEYRDKHRTWTYAPVNINLGCAGEVTLNAWKILFAMTVVSVAERPQRRSRLLYQDNTVSLRVTEGEEFYIQAGHKVAAKHNKKRGPNIHGYILGQRTC